MNNAKQVDALVQEWKAAGKDPADIVWNTALACVSWPYVYSAWGALCTPSERRKRFRMCPSHTTIKTKCKGFDSGNCDGCQWYPGKERVRCYDCRGFTDWCLLQVGIDLYGDTCSVQWNTAKNWASKGVIGTMPKNKLCCLFVQKDGKWQHTGFGYNMETCECSSGVQYTKDRSANWTHWAVPAGLYENVDPDPQPDPEPSPTPKKRPTLRKGDSGPYVVELQTMLTRLGYGLGPCGIDGKFGSCTEAAVEQFQLEHKDTDGERLVVDGIVGPKTWGALDAAIEGSVAK